jgi:hypothetical protein
MLGRKKAARAQGGAFSFRVSDVVDVPLRGTVLRLRLVDGAPSMADLGVGSSIRLRSPLGLEADVQITGHSVTGGRPTQERLDRTRELDVLVDDAALQEPVEIGWTATGPL